MLPIRIELKNFLAYRAPDPIPLHDLHLACLCGHNGAGKSSLLDAITWALWGKARSRSDDDLIHMGQDEMSVTLDFLQDGNQYRVTRKRKIGRRKDGGRGVGTSELTLYGRDDKAFKPISGGVTETQKQIDSLLRLNYDIFVNSAFLQQGKADTFTTKTATERKKILAEILGLERWEKYEEAAKDRVRAIKGQIEYHNSEIAHCEQDIAKEPSLQQEMEYASRQFEVATDAVAEAERLLNEVYGADIELQSARKELASIQLNIKEREKEVITIEKEMAGYTTRLSTFQKIMGDSDHIKDGYARLEEARTADMELGDKLRALNDLNQQIAYKEREISDARQQIELEVRELETIIHQNSEFVSVGDAVHEAMEKLSAEIQRLVDIEDSQLGIQDQIAQLKEERATLIERNQSVREESKEIRRRMDMIEQGLEPVCPLCGQSLDDQHRRDLLAQMENKGKQCRTEFDNNKKRQEDIDAEVEHLQKLLEKNQRTIKELPSLRTEQGKLEQQAKAAEDAAQQMNASNIKLRGLLSTLNDERFAEEIRVELDDLCRERETLGYDSTTHDEVRQQLETYLGYQDRSRELELALESMPQYEKLQQNALERLENCQLFLQTHQEQYDKCAAEIARLEVKEAQLRLRQEELRNQLTNLRNAEERLNSIKQELNSIVRLRERRVKLIEQKAQLAAQETTFDQLKVAFGRNGIPAMIIEAVIPELEDATNRLLSRMTSNRMHVRFDTQREKKTGGIIETLDILIADELGTRDYSLFSGGEAFRINFAIRIALSQLLARRAGAKLRTLFIDEGFGTQDESGRERLVEAITAIQDDFDLILVITHIDELKDAFPAKIEVAKTMTGSMAVVR